jgi:hypothetical protein
MFVCLLTPQHNDRLQSKCISFLASLTSLYDVTQVFTDVATHLETSNVAFSPNGRVLAVGLNANPKSSDCGVMRFYNVYGADTEPEVQIGLAGPGASVVRVLWHTKLRQILATTTAGYTKVRCCCCCCMQRLRCYR